MSKSLVSRMVPAVLFLILGIFWTNEPTYLRYLFLAAALAFAVEGLIKYVKSSREGKDDENSVSSS